MRAIADPATPSQEVLRLTNELLDRLELLRAEFLKVPHWHLPKEVRNERLRSLRQRYRDLTEEARALAGLAKDHEPRIDECLARLHGAFAIAQEAVSHLDRAEENQ